MIRIIEAPEYGLMFLEDDQSGEISIQCLCGGLATWWKRLVLSGEETADYRAGRLDAKRLMAEICRNWPPGASRLIEPIDLNALNPPDLRSRE